MSIVTVPGLQYAVLAYFDLSYMFWNSYFRSFLKSDKPKIRRLISGLHQHDGQLDVPVLRHLAAAVPLPLLQNEHR